MPADDRPEEFQAELDSLLARWRYLDSQHAQRSELSRAQLEVLVSRSDALAEDAAAFEAGL
jgi:hypothetical protein